ncbi:MAG: hypothetical protein K2O91_06645 [Lachnospiraceae bacterium]|nr:hypothetical protein [Lachnospiraceae bacterium]
MGRCNIIPRKSVFWRWIGQNKYLIVFYGLLFSFFHFSIYKLYGFAIFPDEFSYWAYAAKAAGYDWSEVVSLNSFYSCGYSILLFPIFCFFRDALTAYRAAIALNFILIGIAYWILYRILHIFRPDKREECQICSAIALFYPAVLFYAQTTMVETLLVLGYLVLLWLFEQYLRRPSYLNIILLLTVNTFMYFVHMRTIGIFAVCVGLMIFAEARCKKDYRRILFIVIMTIVSLYITSVLKKVTTAYLYQNVNQELYKVNTYGGQFEKIKYIFSRDGITALMAGLCGKILYMGLSTYGMAYWGICFLTKNCYKGICHRKGCGGIMEAFILLTVLSQIMISAIYNVIPDSYDSVTFGRYHDFVMPVLIVVGINEMVCCRRGKKYHLIIMGLFLLMFTMIVLYYVTGLKLNAAKGYFMVGMSFFEPKEFSAVKFYLISCLIGILCMCCFALLFLIYTKSGSRQILFFCTALQLLLALRLGNNYIYPFNRLAYQDIKLAQRIERIINSGENAHHITYIDYNAISAIGLMQFALRDQAFQVVSEDMCIWNETIGERSIILLGADDPVWDQLQKKYNNEVISGHFILLYNDEETLK